MASTALPLALPRPFAPSQSEDATELAKSRVSPHQMQPPVEYGPFGLWMCHTCASPLPRPGQGSETIGLGVIYLTHGYSYEI